MTATSDGICGVTSGLCANISIEILVNTINMADFSGAMSAYREGKWEPNLDLIET